ncbi:polyprenyl synthetase family protein [Enemella sp. A6]|uniref:polyprenyl synthetase family protein n=1 Tax=Enemella sp. A6 TaxID=3440152 RepID=UPI003EBB080A
MLMLPGGPALSSTDIDAAVDGAFRRLACRASAHGNEAVRLVRAARQAGAGGKRFRPRLVLTAFRAFAADDEVPRSVLEVAAGFELLHTAFVIHDDVIDRDVERRGRPNVAGVFRQQAVVAGSAPDQAVQLGDAAAILAGDLLLHEATRVIATAELPAAQRSRLLDLVDRAILVSAGGQLADVEHAVLPRVPDAEEVLAATSDKTAEYSFSAPLQAGALLAGADDDTLAALAAGGRSLGLAFQLVDDLIGAFGTAEQAGREPGADLRQHKHTALLVLARRSENWAEVRRAVAEAHQGPAQLRAAQEALETSGARRRVGLLVEDTLVEARTHFTDAALPGEAMTLLADLAASIRERIP